MAIDKQAKKNVVADWESAFPQLSLYAQDKLYKMISPVIIGLELIKLPRTDEYRPHFVVYPIWKEDVKASLSSPIMLKEYYNTKGLQYSIPYERHEAFFGGVLESVKKQTPLSFENGISSEKVMSVLDEHSKTPPLSAAPNSYLQAVLQDAKLKIALYVSVAEAQSVLGQISKRNWDAAHFKACGADVNTWLQSLEEAILNRDSFLKQIELNKQDKKVGQLKTSELVE